MSIYNKLDLTGWKPRQLTSKEVRFATWIAFFPAISLWLVKYIT